MSKEREYLKKLRYATHLENHLRKELEELLAQPEQEPVAWMYDWTNEIGELIKGVYVGSHKASHLYELENLEPLYTAPPKRKQDNIQYLLDQVARLTAENAMLKEKWSISK